MTRKKQEQSKNTGSLYGAEFRQLLADIATIIANDLTRQELERAAAREVAGDVQQEAQDLAAAVDAWLAGGAA
jgi:hypothetical protein